MAYRFDGKRALITGGSRGIGRSIAKALINAGAEVYAIAQTQANLDKLKTECPKVNIIAVDLADWESTKMAVEKIDDIDLLVNNAAASDIVKPITPFVDTTRDLLDISIAVNLKAAFNISQIVARAMIKRSSGGAIINMSSVAGMKPMTGYSTYCISKAGMDMMTKVMALELGPHKIRVNSISPTGVNTECNREDHEKLKKSGKYKEIIQRHPLGKLTEMEDIVNATLFLLSDRAAMITGTSLPVDCGFMCS